MKQTNRFPEPSGKNGWYETSRYKDHKFNDVSEIQSSYDYIVVGAGFGGVNAAFRLAENQPGASIALFDAMPVGYFSSGRNAGFIIDVPHSIVGDPHFTMDDQKWRFRLNKYVIERMAKIKEENNLEVDWQQAGMFQTAREKGSLKYLNMLAEFLDVMEAEYKWMDKEEVTSKLGTDFYFKALYTPGTILINPSETVRGLATVLPKNVSVFENCPVLEVLEGEIPKVVLTNGKVITCKQVIMTVNAFIKHFGAKNTNNIIGIHSFGAHTRELTDEEIATLGGAKPWGLCSAHPAGATLRYTTTKRLYVRTDITFATHINIAPERLYKSVYKLRRAFNNRFPQLKDVNFEYVYGGFIPLTANTFPYFANVGKNVYAGASGDGTGVTRASMCGTFLADWVCGRDSEELRYMQTSPQPNWVPPEPARTIGATARLIWEDMHARSEI
ncbi:MAG: FAD-binding oxidoreductase [Succinivibrio sp.]|nr:FAD-binding oxidoreductase [Succinivibrio sp.]MBR1613718.1 FAD-binding oxidoreductase [Succinivibrio sp.]